MKTSALLLAASLFAGPAMAQDAPDLKGTWKGETDVMIMPKATSRGEYSLAVTEQNGRAFRGEITYPMDGKPVTEPIVGSIDADGERVVFVGDQGHHQAEFDDGVLKDCYVLASKELSVAYCVDLAKQP